jgi:hypothetical protein
MQLCCLFKLQCVVRFLFPFLPWIRYSASTVEVMNHGHSDPPLSRHAHELVVARREFHNFAVFTDGKLSRAQLPPPNYLQVAVMFQVRSLYLC